MQSLGQWRSDNKTITSVSHLLLEGLEDTEHWSHLSTLRTIEKWYFYGISSSNRYILLLPLSSLLVLVVNQHSYLLSNNLNHIVITSSLEEKYNSVEKFKKKPCKSSYRLAEL
jgi:hypothetical protein